MAEWLVDTRESTCPTCGETYQQIATHWTRSTCPERPIQRDQHEVIRVLLDDGGSVEQTGTKARLSVASLDESHTQQYHDALGWLSRGIQRVPQNGLYRVRTLAHSELTQYLPDSAERDRTIGPAEWPEADALAAVRALGEVTDRPLRKRAYEAYRRTHPRALPSVQYMTERVDIGSWNDILRAAGLDVVRERTADATYGLFLDALIDIHERTGEWPTSPAYPDRQPDWAPARGTAYRMDAFESWGAAIEDAKQRQENNGQR